VLGQRPLIHALRLAQLALVHVQIPEVVDGVEDGDGGVVEELSRTRPSARWYIRSVSPILPWVLYRLSVLLAVSKTDMWSEPSAFSYPASACWNICSVSSFFSHPC
jgi:hypothetical protein